MCYNVSLVLQRILQYDLNIRRGKRREREKERGEMGDRDGDNEREKGENIHYFISYLDTNFYPTLLLFHLVTESHQ